MVANRGTAPNFDCRSPSRVHTGISRGFHKTVSFFARPPSPTGAEWDLESTAATPDLEKAQGARWENDHKSPDTTGQDGLTSPATPQPEPRTLMNLPPELHMVVLQHLDFEDIRNLRRTCRYWHDFVTPRVLGAVWGRDAFRTILNRYCKLCMAYCPSGAARLSTTPRDEGYPLSSRCIRCAVQSRDGTFRVGRRTILSNSLEYWTCRWCGWPVTNGGQQAHPQFHEKCYNSYSLGTLGFFFLGWIQFSIGIVASSLCWHYFSRDKLVLGPTIVGFLMMWFCIIVIGFRGNRIRTYHWVLLVELVIAGLWIPPVYSISKRFVGGLPPRSTQTTMAFIGVNLLFRLLNLIGNIILFFDYDRTIHYLPEIPIWRRFINPMLTALILWTWPKHAERRFPPYNSART